MREPAGLEKWALSWKAEGQLETSNTPREGGPKAEEEAGPLGWALEGVERQEVEWKMLGKGGKATGLKPLGLGSYWDPSKATSPPPSSNTNRSIPAHRWERPLGPTMPAPLPTPLVMQTSLLKPRDCDHPHPYGKLDGLGTKRTLCGLVQAGSGGSYSGP